MNTPTKNQKPEDLDLETFESDFDGFHLLITGAVKVARNKLGFDKALFLREANDSFQGLCDLEAYNKKHPENPL